MSVQLQETIPASGRAAVVVAHVEPKSGSTLFRGALGSVMVQVGGIGVAFGSQVGLAHLLGAGAFGQYVYIIAWVNLLCVFGRVGLDLSSLKFVAEYCTRRQGGLLRGYIRRSVQLGAIVSSAIALLGMGAACTLAGTLEPNVLMAVVLASLLIPILTLQGLFASYLRALKRVVLCQLPRQILSPLAIVAVTYLFVTLSGQIAQATTVLTLSVLVNASLTILTGIVAIRHLRSNYHHERPQTDQGLWFSCSLSLLFVAVVQMINLRIDVLMVGGLLGMKEAGIYTAASQLASLTTLGLVGVNSIAAPMIAELHAKGRRDDFQAFLTQAAWLIALVTVPITVVLASAGPLLLGMFGSEFREGYSALVVLVGGNALSALAGPVGFLVIMTGSQREGAWILGSAAVLNVLMNLVLVPRFGLLGASVATAITTAVWNGSMLVYVCKRLQVNPTIIPRWTASR